MKRRLSIVVGLFLFLARPIAGGPMTLQVNSSAFSEGSSIPTQYTCDGKDVSPPLSWTGLPAATKGVALVCDDPDAPAGVWVHWVVYNLPPSSSGLPEGVPPRDEIAGAVFRGRTTFARPATAARVLPGVRTGTSSRCMRSTPT
jgi:hypothetical protein